MSNKPVQENKREKERNENKAFQRKQQRQLFCCCLFCLLPGAIVWGAAHLQVKGMETVEALVVATTYCFGNKGSALRQKDQYNITFTFELGNGTTVNATTDVCTEDNPTVGSEETVFYDPDDPSDILQDSRFKAYQGTGIGLIATCLLFFACAFVAISKHTEAKTPGTAPGADPLVLQSNFGGGRNAGIGYASAGMVI
ncbi:MAG: hypothetical protein SGBAC_004021 [Bacillariaceae sp.]